MTMNIKWLDETIVFQRGDTVAQALLRHGIQKFGTAESRVPRAVFCGIGQCQNCRIVVNGAYITEACLLPCEDQMEVGPIGERSHG